MIITPWPSSRHVPVTCRSRQLRSCCGLQKLSLAHNRLGLFPEVPRAPALPACLPYRSLPLPIPLPPSPSLSLSAPRSPYTSLLLPLCLSPPLSLRLNLFPVLSLSFPCLHSRRPPLLSFPCLHSRRPPLLSPSPPFMPHSASSLAPPSHSALTLPAGWSPAQPAPSRRTSPPLPSLMRCNKPAQYAATSLLHAPQQSCLPSSLPPSLLLTAEVGHAPLARHRVGRGRAWPPPPARRRHHLGVPDPAPSIPGDTAYRPREIPIRHPERYAPGPR